MWMQGAPCVQLLIALIRVGCWFQVFVMFHRHRWEDWLHNKYQIPNLDGGKKDRRSKLCYSASPCWCLATHGYPSAVHPLNRVAGGSPIAVSELCNARPADFLRDSVDSPPWGASSPLLQDVSLRVFGGTILVELGGPMGSLFFRCWVPMVWCTEIDACCL